MQLLHIAYVFVALACNYEAVPLSSNLQQSMDVVFGKNNIPNNSKFGKLGRDISSAKRYMMGLYQYMNSTECSMGQCFNKSVIASTDSENMVHDADTIVSFVHHPYIPRPNISDEEGAVFFNVESNFNNVDTIKSEIRIYLNTSRKTIEDATLRLSVYEIVIPKTKYTMLASELVNTTESSWHEFDVLRATSTWNEEPSQNNGLLIVCETLERKKTPLQECGLIDVKGEDDYRPFLVSFYQSDEEEQEEYLAEQLPENENSTNTRTRRSLNDLFKQASKNVPGFYERETNRFTCRKIPLYVTFEALKWTDWIIAPEGYKSYYCGGECKFPLHHNSNATNHAIIQTLVHSLSPKRAHPPCCAPSRLEPLTVLYVNSEENVVIKKFSNMIVNDCGCQ